MSEFEVVSIEPEDGFDYEINMLLVEVKEVTEEEHLCLNVINGKAEDRETFDFEVNVELESGNLLFVVGGREYLIETADIISKIRALQHEEGN